MLNTLKPILTNKIAKLVICCLAIFPLFASAEDLYVNGQRIYQTTSFNFETLPYQGDFFDRTFLLDIRQGSNLSQKVYGLRDGSYESAFGTRITFERWYRSNWTDARILWLTQIDKNNGVIWGFNTGESGQKYKINPGFHLGFVTQIEISKNSNFTINAIKVFGGNLREKACQADYGDIGGIQEVNCRLAASMLTPAQTLNYLLKEKSQDEQLMIRFNYSF